MAAGAALLYSKLDAVNECLETIGQQPFGALTSSGSWPSKTYTSDICSQVERILDRTTIEVLKDGFNFNTVGPVVVTPASGKIQISTNAVFNDLYVIRVIPEGQNKKSPMEVVGDYLFNPVKGLGNSASAWIDFTTYCMTMIVGYEFQNCSADAQVLIMRETVRRLTETRLGDELKRRYAVENSAKADITATRPWPTQSSKPVNAGPVLAALGGTGGQGQ